MTHDETPAEALAGIIASLHYLAAELERVRQRLEDEA